MLHEFDAWLEAKYLNQKVRKDRWAWNFGIQQGRPITVHENRQWRPAVAYCRYADDFIVIVKGTKVHALEIREECCAFLEGRLKLTLNMEKSHITHVNDGFVFLGHRIIRKRGSNGRMSVVTTIPKEKAKAFVRKLTMTLSGNHDVSTVDMMDRLNRQLAGWAAFYTLSLWQPEKVVAIRSWIASSLAMVRDGFLSAKERWRTPVRSTPRHGVSCAAASRRPRISAAPAARSSDDSCRPRSRTRPAPRSRLPSRAGTACEPFRPFRRAQKSSANHAPNKNPSRRNWQALFRLPSEAGYI